VAQKWRKARITSPGSPKIPLIAFGNGLFSSNRGGTNRSQLLHKKLKEAEDEGRAVVVLVDEYNTSQVCSVCGLKGLKKLRLPGDELYGVLVCPNCSKVWQRDVNASRNIHYVATAEVGGGNRPVAFRR
jgi:transposase